MSKSPGAGLRVGVIGAGRMGVRHAEAVKRLGMHLCGITDLSPDAAEAACRQFEVPLSAGFTDADAMIEKVKPQAIVIATTAPSHGPFTLKAAQAGVKYILCEKPMASSLHEADLMITACHRAESVLAINHQMRFMPIYSQVKALIGSEALGPIVSILVAGSNFGLAMNASHYFELFRYVTDGPVATIRAWLDRESLANPRGAQFDDRSGRLLAQGADGTTMFIDFSAAAGSGVQTTYICRNGQIFVDELSGHMRVAARKAEFRDLPTTRYGMPADLRATEIPPAETVDSTMAVWTAMFAGQGYPDGEAGRHAVACIVATHLSDRTGGAAVAVDSPDLPRAEVFRWA